MYLRSGHRGGLGDDDTTPQIAIPAASGLPPGIDVAGLVSLEVNRFTGPAAGNFKIANEPFSIATGRVPADVAGAALGILQIMGLDAALETADPGAGQVMRDAASHLSDAQAYVNANAKLIAATLSSFADAKNLPKPSVFDTALALSMPIKIGLGLAVGLIAMRMLIKPKKGRR